MSRIAWMLGLVAVAGVLVLGGCSQQKKHTLIEERTTKTTEGGPVITGDPAPWPPQPGTVERTETRREQIITREPVVK